MVVITRNGFCKRTIISCYFCGALLSTSPAAFWSTEFDLRALAKKTWPSVLLIEVFESDGSKRASGSGFLVAPGGVLVTNAHVIRGGAKATAKTENGASFAVAGVIRCAGSCTACRHRSAACRSCAGGPSREPHKSVRALYSRSSSSVSRKSTWPLLIS